MLLWFFLLLLNSAAEQYMDCHAYQHTANGWEIFVSGDRPAAEFGSAIYTVATDSWRWPTYKVRNSVSAWSVNPGG